MPAVQTIDQSALNYSWGPFAANSVPGIGQIFTSLGGALSKVELFADWEGGSGPIEYRILIVQNDATSGNFSPGTVLARSAVQTLPVDSDNNPKTLSATFSGVNLTSGAKYAILLDISPSADADGAGVVMSITHGPGVGPDYTGGSAVYYQGAESGFYSSNWSTAADFDLSFRLTYGSNAAPTHTAPAAGLTFTEDTAAGLPGVSVGDADGDSLTTIVSVSNGTLSSVGAQNGATTTILSASVVRLAGTVAQVNASIGGLRYLPNANYVGSATLSFATSDGVGTINASVAINILPVNDLPTAVADTAVVTSFGSVSGSVRTNDSDVETANSALTVVSVGGAGGVMTPSASSSLSGAYGHLAMQSSGAFAYSADAATGVRADDVVSDVFNYIVSDGTGGTAQTTLTVQVTGRSQGGAGDDIIVGNDLANNLSGLGGADSLSGAGGDDILTGGAGNDTLDGGAGVDTAVYTGPAASYLRVLNADGSVTVTDQRSGSPEGTDNLRNIELLKFSDKTISTTPPATAAPLHDFDLNGRADLVWRGTDGSVRLWSMNGAAITSDSAVASIPTDWKIVGVGDVTGDGRADLVWESSAGEVRSWTMNGASITFDRQVATGIPSEYAVQRVADFTGDGKADLVWRSSASGAVRLWTMNANGQLAADQAVATVSTDWKIAGAGDFDGDGKADILWRNDNGANRLWLMNGASIALDSALGNGGASVPTNWKVENVGDINGDGKADIVWHSSQGEVRMWLMNGAAIAADIGLANGLGFAWSVQDISDFTGDGRADLMWRNADTGEVRLWTMSASGIAADQRVALVGSEYHIVNSLAG